MRNTATAREETSLQEEFIQENNRLSSWRIEGMIDPSTPAVAEVLPRGIFSLGRATANAPALRFNVSRQAKKADRILSRLLIVGAAHGCSDRPFRCAWRQPSGSRLPQPLALGAIASLAEFVPHLTPQDSIGQPGELPDGECRAKEKMAGWSAS